MRGLNNPYIYMEETGCLAPKAEHSAKAKTQRPEALICLDFF